MAFRATLTALGIGAHPVVFKLSSLFALTRSGGGFVVQSFAAYWFYLRFGVNPGTLGAISSGEHLCRDRRSCIAAGARFGLIKTMVATHCRPTLLMSLP